MDRRYLGWSDAGDHLTTNSHLVIESKQGEASFVLFFTPTKQDNSEVSFQKNAYSECEDAFNKILNQIRNKVEREAYVKEQIVKRAGDMLRLPTFAPPDNNWLGCSELNLPKGVEVYVRVRQKNYILSASISFNADSKRFEVSNLSGTCKPAYETTKEMIDLDVEKRRFALGVFSHGIREIFGVQYDQD